MVKVCAQLWFEVGQRSQFRRTPRDLLPNCENKYAMNFTVMFQPTFHSIFSFLVTHVAASCEVYHGLLNGAAVAIKDVKEQVDLREEVRLLGRPENSENFLGETQQTSWLING